MQFYVGNSETSELLEELLNGLENMVPGIYRVINGELFLILKNGFK